MRYKLFIVAVVLFTVTLLFSIGSAAHAAGPSATFTLGCSSITGTATNPLGTTVFDISLIDVTTQQIVLNQVTTAASFSFPFTGVNPGDTLTVLVSDGAYGAVYSPLGCGGSAPQGGSSNASGTSGTSSGSTGGTLSVRTIVCNTPMFDSPGGGAVGGTSITAGQTWTVNSAGQTDSKGQSWLQLYIGGAASGWVPASCVQ